MTRRVLVLACALAITVAAPGAAQETSGARPISLGDALELAGGASENAGIARIAVGRARGERKQARSGYFPQLTASATYTRTLESQFDIARDAAAQIPARC